MPIIKKLYFEGKSTKKATIQIVAFTNCLLNLEKAYFIISKLRLIKCVSSSPCNRF